jgi:hypothetical protein
MHDLTLNFLTGTFVEIDGELPILHYERKF